MGNDNWDRIQPPGTIAAAFKMSLVSLEEKVNELYGSGQFDWTIGSSEVDGKRVWFYMAGTKVSSHGRNHWAVDGEAPTIADALMALIQAYDG